MEVFRIKSIPYDFSGLDFIRICNDSFINCQDYSWRLDLFRDLVLGVECLSIFDSANLVMVIAEIPEDVLNAKDDTGGTVGWSVYFYRPVDAEYTVDAEEQLPWDAVGLEEANVRPEFISELVDRGSIYSVIEEGFVI